MPAARRERSSRLGMSDVVSTEDDELDDQTGFLEGGSHRKPKRSRGVFGCLAALVALAVVVAAGYFALSQGMDTLKSHLGGGPPDYPGPGSGQVLVEVH